MSGAGSETAEDAISPEVARAWIERWDVQQQGYLPDREDRFTALIDAVEEAAGRPDPLVLDLGSGPGSLAVRLLRRIPAARVIALDADPLTLGLGRAAWHDLPGALRDGQLTWTLSGSRTPRSARRRCTGCPGPRSRLCTPSWPPCSAPAGWC
jgi:SAM-dependent methyltransferase